MIAERMLFDASIDLVETRSVTSEWSIPWVNVQAKALFIREMTYAENVVHPDTLLTEFLLHRIE